MKKFLMVTALILFGFTVYGQTYESVERTDTFGLIPALSDTNERTDGYYLPSLLAANKKGYGYIDCNFTKGGLILPFLGKSLVLGVWYEHGNNRNMVDIQEIMSWLQPTGPAVPDTRHLMGLAFAANINQNIAIGLNFRYLLGRHFEENSDSANKNTYKLDTNRIELNPSLTFRTGRIFVDFGLGINFQWMTEKAEGTFEYDRTTTYDGNADFAFWARGGFPFNEYSDFAVSTGFGVMPIREHALNNNGDKVSKIELDTYFWNLKFGSVIKPQKWMKIHPGVMLSLYHLDTMQKQMASVGPNPETFTGKNNILVISMMLGLDVIPVDWFSIKAGVKKDVNVVDNSTDTAVAEDRTKDKLLQEAFGAYFGPAFMWKGFTFISMINLDFFMEGPYIISGKQMTSNWAYVATVEYQW